MEAGDLLGKLRQLLSVKRVFQLAAAKNQIDILMRHVMVHDKVGHAAERRNSCSGANKEQISFNDLRKCEDTLWTAQRQLAADRDMIEQIECPRAALQEYDHQLDDVAAIRPGGDGVATNAFSRFFVDG